MMAALSARSEAAIARLRSYVPPPTSWYSLPLSRRSAVLILLFADKKGDLRVVLTMRASTLSSYAGQAALPGGKSDTLAETPIATARREASEEIGLPAPTHLPSITPVTDALPDAGTSPTEHPAARTILKATPSTPGLPAPFSIEHLTELPTNLARTELGVRPVVAFLSTASNPTTSNPATTDAEAILIPRLDAKEVAAVFSAPLHNFLLDHDELPIGTLTHAQSTAWQRANRTAWYAGQWIDWHERRWRMHNFYVPVAGQVVTWPREKKKKQKAQAAAATSPAPPADPPSANTRSKRPGPSANLPYRDRPQASDANSLENAARYRVFGMTARILVDCARVAYGAEPAFEHNAHFGDEEMIAALMRMGRLRLERERGEEFTGEDLRRAVEEGKKMGRL